MRVELSEWEANVIRSWAEAQAVTWAQMAFGTAFDPSGDKAMRDKYLTLANKFHEALAADRGSS